MALVKAQSAIEYLMTYGWMLLVVAIVGGVIFSVVDNQSISSVSGFTTNDVIIQDFGVSRQNGLMFSMNDPLGETVLKEVRVTDSSGINTTYQINQELNQEQNLNLPGIITSGQNNELQADITYNQGSLAELRVSGTVTGNLEIDEAFDNQTVIKDGLVGFWPLDEKYSSGNEVYDLTANNNQGKLLNEPAKKSAEECKIGECINFDGNNDYLSVTGGRAYNFTNVDYSLSTWIRTKDGFATIISQSDSVSSLLDGYALSLGSGAGGDPESGEVVFQHRNVETNNDDKLWTDGFKIDDGEWHHVAVISQGGYPNTSIYVDGEERSVQYFRSDGPDTIDPTPYDIQIGGKNGEPYLNGSIDQVHIYNRALSQDEIQTIYEQGADQ